MNRRIHAFFALVALGLVAVLVAAWPHPARLPLPAPLPGAATSSPTTGPTGPAGPTTAPPTTVLPCPAPGPVGRLRVLTFNIHGALDHTGQHLAGIADEIRTADPDVVLLQEVDRHRARTHDVDQPTALSGLLGMHVVFGSNVVRPPARAGDPVQEYGTAILSRLPIHSWRNVPLPNQPHLEPRGLLRATITVAGQDVDVYDTHLQHTRGNIRIVQMRAIRRLVAGDPRPHLLGGDFNATPDSPALAVADSFMTDPWPQVGRGEGLTVPVHVPHRRIDYVLHDDRWVPDDAQVLDLGISDHRALRVDYTLPRPPGCSRPATAVRPAP
ncbi:MAG: endonuclease/exonuclease/phosphatase family protein [Nocardioides sp.]